MTFGERIVVFIDAHCKIPERAQVGQNTKLMKFRKQFIMDVYDNPYGTGALHGHFIDWVDVWTKGRTLLMSISSKVLEGMG